MSSALQIPDETSSTRSFDERKMSYKFSFRRRSWSRVTTDTSGATLTAREPIDGKLANEKPRRNSFDAFVQAMMVRVGSQSSVSSEDTFKKETYKMQKQKYHYEKRRAAQEIMHTLQDPAVVVMADWLKIRGSLRKWMKVYCVLKPGMLLLYKSAKTNKHGYWIGTVLLASCELIERPSKKNGFCFKLFHPLDQSIWATRGPTGESFGAVTMPLPTSYLICRAPSEEAGRCWMDGLELALRCSNLLLRTMHKPADGGASVDASSPMSPGEVPVADLVPELDLADTTVRKVVGKREISETEAERHFAEAGLGDENALSDSDNEAVFAEDVPAGPLVERTIYAPAPAEEFGPLGDADQQTEEVADENKSLIWTLMKQLRPGMDLSKVVLPTFILEPRSFLEKLADFYYHVDLLGRATKMDDSFQRMKAVVKFYLSGFYKKPKGLKKPFNPILGEVFRCHWYHKDTDSRTFYISEQVSHHPPVSAFFVTNRKEGFTVGGTILAKSKFYGNSLSAIMAGSGKITLLTRGENYLVTLPYAHCKGLILGTLTMELGGQVKITCDRTSYSTELEFKLKPMFGGVMNAIAGKIRLGNETMADIDGHWDSVIYITHRQTGVKEVLWRADPEIIKERLKRFDVPLEKQDDFESQRMWVKVAEAIKNSDQVMATEEKTVLEEAQRKRAKELRERNELHRCRFFDFDPISGQYSYKHADFRPWDAQNDVEQYEGNFTIVTESRHAAPVVRTMSVSSQLTGASGIVSSAVVDGNEWSEDDDSPTGEANVNKPKSKKRGRIGASLNRDVLNEALQPLRDDLDITKRALLNLREKVDIISDQTRKQSDNQWVQFLILVALFVAFQAVMMVVWKHEPTSRNM